MSAVTSVAALFIFREVETNRIQKIPVLIVLETSQWSRRYLGNYEWRENMASLDLTLFEKHFSEGKNFEITEEEYVNNVKKKLPQTQYFVSRSPVACKAREFGYKVRVEERVHRVLVFTKKGA